MKLITYEWKGQEQAGVLSTDKTVIYSFREAGLPYDTMQEFISESTGAEREKLSAFLAEAENQRAAGSVSLEPTCSGIPYEQAEKCAPIPVPAQDMICLGINYMEHAEESARYKKEAFGGERPYAVYFSKRINRAVSDGGSIDSHGELTERLDYEAELAVIIGKDAKDVPKEKAGEYVFGYTIINDVSARDVQIRHKQWYFGKSLDDFTPMGPWIVTADEIPYPPKQKIQSYVNGELRQDSNTELLIFGISHVISELSSGMTLKAGTIIAMGTPAGVGMGFEPPRFLVPGDEVICSIEGIGKIRNVVR